MKIGNLIKRAYRKVFPKKHHWYAVRCTYRHRTTKIRVFDFTWEVGLAKQQTILNHRSVKITLPPLHKMDKVPNHLLGNGKLEVEFICYLGRFKTHVK